MARPAPCRRWGCRGTFKATVASLPAGVCPGFPAPAWHKASGDPDLVLLSTPKPVIGPRSHSHSEESQTKFWSPNSIQYHPWVAEANP